MCKKYHKINHPDAHHHVMNEILVEGRTDWTLSLSLSLSLFYFEVILGEFHSINNNVSEEIYEKSKPIYL